MSCQRAGRLAVLLVAVCLSPLAAATATAQRTFVSGQGVDNPSCSIVSPCRGFAAAVAATASGGEVIVVDSAGYGQVTITQSVSIIAPAGIYSGVSVMSGIGIEVKAPASWLDCGVLPSMDGCSRNYGNQFTQGAS
jgi:hypothetical protein